MASANKHCQTDKHRAAAGGIMVARAFVAPKANSGNIGAAEQRKCVAACRSDISETYSQLTRRQISV